MATTNISAFRLKEGMPSLLLARRFVGRVCCVIICFVLIGFYVQLEFDLLRFLKKKFQQNHRVSVERVISGTGLYNVRPIMLLFQLFHINNINATGL